MDTVTATRNLLGAIREFGQLYANDTRFRDVLATLRDAAGTVQGLVPAATPAEQEQSPGKRSAIEAAKEAAGTGTKPEQTSDANTSEK